MGEGWTGPSGIPGPDRATRKEKKIGSWDRSFQNSRNGPVGIQETLGRERGRIISVRVFYRLGLNFDVGEMIYINFHQQNDDK